MSPMPMTRPPDDDFPQKPLATPRWYCRAIRHGRYHLVDAQWPNRGRVGIVGSAHPALCGFGPKSGWRGASRAPGPVPLARICPRCLEVLRRRPTGTPNAVEVAP